MSTPATAMPRFKDAVALVEPPRKAFVEMLMGMPVSVHVRGPQARGPQVASAVRDMFAELRCDDQRFSTWIPDSPVSRIRRGELRLEDAEPRIRQVAALCEEAAGRTDGAFQGWLPGPEGRALFDPTGLVKGWTVEQAFNALVQRLDGLGRHDALVSAGGDIAVACTRADTPDWRIGVENPRERGSTLITVPLRCGAVATSGTAARGQHIIDPATGAPPEGLLSATIIGPSLTWADVYATAAFVRGRQAAGWVRGLPDHAAVLVWDDGSVQTVTNDD